MTSLALKYFDLRIAGQNIFAGGVHPSTSAIPPGTKHRLGLPSPPHGSSTPLDQVPAPSAALLALFLVGHPLGCRAAEILRRVLRFGCV